jgi:hypothetical protein
MVDFLSHPLEFLEFFEAAISNSSKKRGGNQARLGTTYHVSGNGTRAPRKKLRIDEIQSLRWFVPGSISGPRPRPRRSKHPRSFQRRFRPRCRLSRQWSPARAASGGHAPYVLRGPSCYFHRPKRADLQNQRMPVAKHTPDRVTARTIHENEPGGVFGTFQSIG